MPINKNAVIRYQALDKCFSNPGRNYSIQDLLEACNNALREFDQNSEGIKKRQLYDDIRFMESSQGYSIELEKTKVGKRTFYRYSDTSFSINNNPINELEAEQLKSAMMVLKRFKGLPQFEWVNELLPKLDQSFNLYQSDDNIMSFEHNPYLRGLELLDPLFNAINHKKTLEITYQPFGKDEFKVHFFPYHLKQYNTRWFLIGRNVEYTNFSNYALDRIVKVNEIEFPFQDTDVDFEEYYEDVVGVSINEGECERIVLKANNKLWPYIKTKPIHGSQKPIKISGNFSIFSLDIIPNYELEKLILSFGEDIEVLGPESFRAKIFERLKDNINQYN
jgi:predicted DNA-binding transcriptional regulator YafY